MVIQTCFNCKNTIISKHHKEQCKTVFMNQHITIKIDDLAKTDMMTFGLAGCTAFICVSNDYITMGHYAPTMEKEIINILKHEINKCHYIYIKMPINWVKNSYTGKWMHNDLKIYDFINKSVCNVIIKDIYNSNKILNNELVDYCYMSSIYVKYNKDSLKKISYTNNYGLWINI